MTMKLRTSRRTFLQRAAGLAAAPLILSAQSMASPGKTVFRFRDSGAIKQIDPLLSTNYPMRDMCYTIFDTLFALDADFNVQPQMVESFTLSEDKKTYRFKLRRGLKFHDGAPVKSADCIASIKRWMDKDSLGHEIARRLDSMKPDAETSFTVMLKEPFSRVLDGFARMTAYPLFIMPERIAKTPVTQPIPEVMGSGPFKLVKNEWVPGVKLVVEKNYDYVPRSEPPSNLAGGKVAKVDRIERIDIPDDVSAVNALVAGELDYMKEIPFDMLKIVRRNSDMVIRPQPLLGKSIQIVLNFTQPPFDNITVRQALQLALNQQDFMQALFGADKSAYKLCPAVFMCGGPYATDVNSARYMHTGSSIEADRNRAKALLKEAGYDGTPILFMHPTDNYIQLNCGAVLVDLMRKAGFVVQDEQMDLATMFSRRNNDGQVKDGGWNVFLTAFNGDAMMDPLTNPYDSGAGKNAFVGWPDDKKLREDWQEFLLAEGKQARYEAAVKIQQRVNEIVTFIPMGQYQDTSAWHKDISGFVESPVLLYWNVSKAQA